MIFVCWSKTNQMGEYVDKVPLVAKVNSSICPVHWILHMIDRIPAEGSHNLFCFLGEDGIVPIMYRDIMVYLRFWLDALGEDSKAFSSHSL